jgi:hypothetical protein
VSTETNEKNRKYEEELNGSIWTKYPITE